MLKGTMAVSHMEIKPTTLDSQAKLCYTAIYMVKKMYLLTFALEFLKSKTLSKMRRVACRLLTELFLLCHCA